MGDDDAAWRATGLLFVGAGILAIARYLETAHALIMLGRIGAEWPIVLYATGTFLVVWGLPFALFPKRARKVVLWLRSIPRVPLLRAGAKFYISVPDDCPCRILIEADRRDGDYIGAAARRLLTLANAGHIRIYGRKQEGLPLEKIGWHSNHFSLSDDFTLSVVARGSEGSGTKFSDIHIPLRDLWKAINIATSKNSAICNAA